MSKNRILVVLAAVLIIFFTIFMSVARYALANGCPTRNATQAEKEFQVKTMTAIKNSLPLAPPGWKIISEDRVEAQDRVCIGTEKEPMRFSFSIEFRKVEGEEERERNLQNAIMKSMPSKEQQAKLDELMKMRMTKAKEMAEKIQKAVERKDYKEVDRLGKENEKFNKQIEQQERVILDENRKKLLQETEKYLPRDTKAEILVSVNDSGGEGGWKAKPITLPGVAIAFRTDGERVGDIDWREGRTTIFLGDWRTDASRSENPVVRANVNKSAPHIKVQTLKIVIQADKDRADQLFQRININSLRNLIK